VTKRGGKGRQARAGKPRALRLNKQTVRNLDPQPGKEAQGGAALYSFTPQCIVFTTVVSACGRISKKLVCPG
jgi:hypothetical protein